MKLSKIWMVMSLVIIVVASVITNAEILQITASVCGVIYVFNTVFENRYGQLFGVANSLLYGVIMYTNGVYGTSIYNMIYCIPMQIYTFFTWGNDKSGKEKLSVSRYTNRQRLGIGIITVSIIALYVIIAGRLSVQFVLVDGISIILGVFALYMTSKKKIEQWYCFIISNIAMLVMWGIKCIENISNIPMLVMWIVYLVNNIYGLYVWNKKLSPKTSSKK